MIFALVIITCTDPPTAPPTDPTPTTTPPPIPGKDTVLLYTRTTIAIFTSTVPFKRSYLVLYAVTCPPGPSINNGNLVSTGFTPGNTLTYSCFEGYQLVGN